MDIERDLGFFSTVEIRFLAGVIRFCLGEVRDAE
jgi:hypothetical protein